MQIVEYRIAPHLINDELGHRMMIANALSVGVQEFQFQIIRRSIDARQRVMYIIRAEVFFENEKLTSLLDFQFEFKNAIDAPEVHIIGAGPCGYFAALECLLNGIKPIVIDRGKDVRERRRDLRAIQQEGIVNPDSNYCFGEGGAGTYSDGKLYTRSDKRGNIKKVLQLLVHHGAKEDILVDAHPHIGSNKLPDLIARMRETITSHGGEVNFNTRVEDFFIEKNKIKKLICSTGDIDVDRVILATGHSARDIYYLLHKKQIAIETKSYALGVRIEHAQSLIDEIQYKQKRRDENLPAASYSLSCTVDQKGVFSFCMCPGGLIVPASTSPGEIVVNGMSLSRRDSPFANSGLVTSVDEQDFSLFKSHGVLQGLEFQKWIEQKMFSLSDGTQRAPAQMLADFLGSKTSDALCDTSYIPGLISAPLHSSLPQQIVYRLQKGLLQFAKKMPKYIYSNAVLVGTESRTSSPVRIPRDAEHCHHPQIVNLYPAGEGAGYAGGIVSAAMDGIHVVNKIALNLKLI